MEIRSKDFLYRQLLQNRSIQGIQMTIFSESCNNCGADYIIEAVEDSTTDEPVVCPFCGDELESYIIDRDTIQELDFDSSEE